MPTVMVMPNDRADCDNAGERVFAAKKRIRGVAVCGVAYPPMVGGTFRFTIKHKLKYFFYKLKGDDKKSKDKL